MFSKKINQRTKEDKGAAMTMMGLFVIILTFVLANFLIDYGYATHLKNAYERYAEAAVQAAIKEQNAVGGLHSEAANKFIREYMIRRNPERDTVEGVTGSGTRSRGICDYEGSGYPKIRIVFNKMRETGLTEDSSPIYQSLNGEEIEFGGDNFATEGYNSLNVQLIDVVQNQYAHWLSSDIGARRPCQEIRIDVSGVGVSAYDQDDARNIR